jgi:hypothetical protein
MRYDPALGDEAIRRFSALLEDTAVAPAQAGPVRRRRAG